MIYDRHDAVLVLSDGRSFFGKSLGKKGSCVGEVCFTTGFSGYQYTITDPSFAGQIIVFSFPHIGNVGINHKDFEHENTLARGVVVREVSCASHISSWIDLNSWMDASGIGGISGVDTRALILHLREHGSQNGIIHHFDDYNLLNLQKLREAAAAADTPTVGTELPHLKNYQVSHDGLKICVIDAGAKRGMLNALVTLGCAVHVIAAKDDFAAQVMKLRPHGIVISNGPGDPHCAPQEKVEQIRTLIKCGIPILGICLGHQLLAISMGARTVKMRHGHRGSNHPVYNTVTKSVEITSQNHGFTVDASTLPKNVEVTHTSLFDGTVEGMRLLDYPVFSVQYHPEGCPGPHDSQYIIRDFISLAKSYRGSEFRPL
ncbi:glutamine-hydrolyzing carbamoyl-phosphate synthase small subunit [Anaplasma capra]|uniref:glutamine-hydrolyzing carbamoyl-phosphate synthase small subunit n=1 Tax=Anaplasma capra TaxID=1562740 RepID=UPI0021D5C2F0|nr:glutamine-hydrolyzing carbamoyl-phosphate synthase small subunit [Anaplasma capra]MCU7611551.1 glutamine-hydrolyzing carbamoyl-phosphate synthase small subunit [Anaplasma capra]MCU7612010.1 glutamine-hydrolyzing carbamoyl-phosphate synthase small subunit [Anaplasma capra]